jgi:S-adenosylmethionine hydrolase
LFVGPDNGIFSYVIDRESDARVFHITNSRLFHEPLSNTFHGRDIFAPVGAALSTGITLEEVGPVIKDEVRLPSLALTKLAGGSLRGRIIHIDRFGNCVTNFTAADLTPEMLAAGARLKIKGKMIRNFRQFFAEGRTGELFAIWGSAGFLEIVMRNKSAAETLRAKCGDEVVVSQ